MNLTRRDAMIGAAVVTPFVTTGTASNTIAQPTAEMKGQTPGIYRHQVGEHTIVCITDGANSFPRADGFVSNVPAEVVKKTLEDAFRPTDQIPLTFTPSVVERGGRVTVIDTGLGPAFYRSSKGVGGQFHTNLRKAGYEVDWIGDVLITHFHADHIGGLIDEDGKPAFPKSTVHVPKAEYAFWMDDAKAAQAASAVVKSNLERAKRIIGILGDQVKQFDPDVEIVPGVTSIATPGHTPGHSSFIVRSDGRQAIIQGDATTQPDLFVERPHWHSWSDMDPVVAEQSRRKLYDLAASEKIIIQGFHFGFPTLGHISKRNDGYRYVPIHWSPVV